MNRFLSWLLPAVSFFIAFDSTAQIKASEPASLTQTIDGTEITIEYSRPSLRGRERMFGGQVYWGEVWTPGADWATTIEFSKDVRMGGVPVPAGKYSLWMVVVQGDWDVILEEQSRRWHLPELTRTDDQIQFTVTPDTTAPLMETLVFYFPEVRPDGADLRFHWVNTVVDMTIEVEPSQQIRIEESVAEPYLGEWSLDVERSQMGPATTFDTELRWENEYLMGRFELGGPLGTVDIILAPVADQVFTPVWTINGQPASILRNYFFEFVMDDMGRAVSFEARNPSDAVWITGERVR